MKPLVSNYSAYDHMALNILVNRIPGWSDARQHAFFKAVLDQRPDIEDILILGVYHARDIAFILDLLDRHHPGRRVNIVGVDRFTPERCADWPRWAFTWEQLTKGMPPPNLASAWANVGQAGNVTLVQSDDTVFLEATAERFDLVYLDTSHDYLSVKGLLGKVRKVCNPDAIICGDDFSNANGWGVKLAVEESFESVQLLGEWVWYSDLGALKA